MSLTSRDRIGIGLLGLAASAFQVFVGALSSLGLGAPGIGPEADWIPPTLVTEGFTLVPLGFALTVWGSAWGLRLAAVCAGIVAATTVVVASVFSEISGPVDWMLWLVPSAILAGLIIYVAHRESIALLPWGR